MKHITLAVVAGIACFGLGVIVGIRFQAKAYAHGHTDGLVAGVCEEYNRCVNKDISQMDAATLANHKLHLDFLEKRIEGIFASSLPYSPELKTNWINDLKSKRTFGH